MMLLELREPLRYPLNMRGITPDRLARLSYGEIARLPLRQGDTAVALGDLFQISGRLAARLIIRNVCPRMEYLGAYMRDGSLGIEGHAGDYLGFAMRGGHLRAYGDAGAYAGAAMRGGGLRVEGRAGAWVGAARAGGRMGMRGGLILLKGDAGPRLGDQMRGGTILLEGNAGDFCASRMSGGTIAVLGQAGHQAGQRMRGGILLCRRLPASLPPGVSATGSRALAFLALLLRDWQRLDSAFARLAPARQPVLRWIGDQACGGQGEILIWEE